MGNLMMGKFIVVEGVDGAGKSLLVNSLYNCIRRANEGTRILKTLEPGGTPVGSALRKLLLDSSLDMSPRTQMLLMTAARAEHIRRLILPALINGAHVICDRYVDSTYAYQGAQDVLWSDITRAHDIAGGLLPDLVILLDLPLSVARERSKKVHDRYESKSDSYFMRVRDLFVSRAVGWPGSHQIIDATQTKSHILNQACLAVRRIGVDTVY